MVQNILTCLLCVRGSIIRLTTYVFTSLRPSIRDELIKLSQTNQGKAYEIMHFAGKCCYLDAPSDVWTDLSDDKLNRIVCDLRNWKLSDRFFERFPWWRKLYVQSIAMFQTA